MSRVQRAPATAGVSMATSRRTAAVYQPKPAHPIMTAFMVVNTIIFAFSASICAVIMTKGQIAYRATTQTFRSDRATAHALLGLG